MTFEMSPILIDIRLVAESKVLERKDKAYPPEENVIEGDPQAATGGPK